MASPYQQRARYRKLLYLVLVGVLFTATLVGRRWLIAPQAERLAIREESRGEVDLTDAGPLSNAAAKSLEACGMRHAAAGVDLSQYNTAEVAADVSETGQPQEQRRLAGAFTKAESSRPNLPSGPG